VWRLQLSATMECWLQSNVKDVMRLIARLLWGTKVELGWRETRSLLIWFVGTGPFGVGQSPEPTVKRQRGPDSVDEGLERK
jgi:hypothetical protein